MNRFLKVFCKGFLYAAFLLFAGCVTTSPIRQAKPVPPVDATFQSIALLPVQFVSAQPDSFCHADIGDDLRSTLARRLRSRGYKVVVVPDRSPLSFSLDRAAPDPGISPEFLELAPADVQTAMALWVEDYMATTLCEAYGPKTLEMAVAAVLYQLPTGQELGRWRAKEWDNGTGSSSETVWRVLERLADRLLIGIP